jgi:hypothetical protein
MRKPLFPTEGDLIFEKKPLYREIGILWILFLLVLISTFFSVKDFIFNPNVFDGILATVCLAFSLFFVWFSFEIIKEGLRAGFSDESFKAYYFSDKIVFYRISIFVDSGKINFRRAKIKINNEQIKILGEPQNQEEISELTQIILVNVQLQEEIETLEKSSRKPHKLELEFSEVKYFMNEKDGIKMVLKYQEDENDLDTFYNKLALAPKYKKHQTTIVEFLNQRVAEFNL